MGFIRRIIFIAFTVIPFITHGQEFYFGHDLSYVNQMEDCGAVFKENGLPKDVYTIFADHGANLVRVRLWVDPSWWQDSLVQPEGVKAHYNDLEDVKETIRRARESGMKVMLGLHYSDFWADPGRQLIPRRWLDVAYSLEDLKDSVYNYTLSVLSELEEEGLMPDLVKVGNENNGGILRHIPEENGWEPVESVSNSWARHAQLFNAAIAAVREVGSTASIHPKIVIHFSNKLSGQVWNYQNIINNGVTDFDVIGISYYYAWHGGSIGELESTILNLVSTFPGYEVMVAETGYLWTTENFDGLGNIINTPDPEYLPVSPEKQLEYMVDFTRAVKNGGGTGVVFWEPAWVSTPCRTPWGIGSSHDHVVFFDPADHNFMENGGGRWCENEFYEDTITAPKDLKVTLSGDFLIYPNPAGYRFFVKMADPLMTTSVRIYELAGREVHSWISSSKSAELMIDVENLAEGLYIVAIQQSGISLFKKIMITRG
jgi:arabinogalactan endo-1,4-beta-galactosidase